MDAAAKYEMELVDGIKKKFGIFGNLHDISIARLNRLYIKGEVEKDAYTAILEGYADECFPVHSTMLKDDLRATWCPYCENRRTDACLSCVYSGIPQNFKSIKFTKR